MSAIGYIQARAFASTAQLPLRDVAITITSTDGTAIAMRLTDRSGLIAPIPIPVPDKSESESPNPDEKPYTSINLYAWKQGYEMIESEDIQVFAGITTLQDLEMVPLDEFPEGSDQEIEYDTPPQDL